MSATPVATTVFCQDIVRTLHQCGYPINAVLASLISSTAPHQHIPIEKWAELKNEVCQAVHVYLGSNPQQALSILTSITHAIRSDVVVRYAGIVFDLVENRDLFRTWALATTEDEKYAFSTFFTLCGAFIKQHDLMSATVSDVLGKKVQLGSDLMTWIPQFTLEAFGPAWQALYMHGDMHDDEFINHILNERPPFIDCPVVAPNVRAKLPTSEL